MANTIQIKRGSGTPTTSNLAEYELGYDYAANKLYIHDDAEDDIIEITGTDTNTTYLGGTGLTLSSTTFNVDASQTQITAVGTIGTGVWNGTAVASAYLDADTAHLSTTQTFSGAKTFQGDLSMDNGNATMLALKGTRWGYSSSYKALQIGATSGTYAIALGYDPSGNDYNGFQGDGREILFRRGIQFVTPNAADDSMYLYNLVMLDGKVGIGQVTPGYTLDVTGNARFTADIRSEGRLMGQNGSAAAPSYSFTSQGNAGMYRYGDGVALAAGGAHTFSTDSTKMFINQYVGIGTSSPTSRLHIYNGDGSIPDDANNHLLIEDDGHCYIGVGGGTSSDVGLHFMDSGGIRGRVAYHHAADTMTFNTSNALAMTIQANGNLLLNNKALTGINGLYGQSGTLQLYNNTYHFKNTSSGGMMSLTSTGLGIGTTSPEGKVHIYQSDASVVPDADGDDLVIESDADTGISILSGEGNGETGALIFGSDNDAFGAGLQHHYYGNALRLMTANTGHSLEFATDNNTTAMTINSSQDVTVNAGSLTIPATEKIYLDGGDDTFIYEIGANIMCFRSHGSDRMKIGPYGEGVMISENFGATDDYVHINPANGGNRKMTITGNDIDVITVGGGANTLNLQGNGGDVLLGSHLEMGDGKELKLGGNDGIRMQGGNSNGFIDNYTGNLYFRQKLDQGWIHFMADNSSGTSENYYDIDGTNQQNKFSKKVLIYAAAGDVEFMMEGGASNVTPFKISNGAGNNRVDFMTAGGQAMTINSSRNVGIGTTSINGKLTVRDDTAGSPTRLTISNGGTAQSGTASRLSFYEGQTEKSYIERRRDGSGITAFHTPADDNPFTWNNATGEFMRFTNSRVGIGTNDPSFPLDVAGDIGIDGYMNHNGDDAKIGFEGNDAIRMYTGSAVSLAIDSNGHVGIREASPTTELHFGTCPDARVITFDQSGRYSGIGTYFSSGATDSRIDFFLSDGGTNNDTNQEFAMYASGNFHADADVIAYSSSVGSDIKLKKNVEDISYGLDDVLKMRAVEFDWKEKRQGKHDIGVIAQELEKIIPEVVQEVDTLKTDGETHKVVDYAKLTSVLIKAIQQQQEEIDLLKANYSDLKYNRR